MYVKKYAKQIFLAVVLISVLPGLFSNYSYVIYAPYSIINTLGKVDDAVFFNK